MVGILVPMPEEIEMILSKMVVFEKQTIGMRDFHIGTLEGKDCVIALSRIGKVASAVTAATMINQFGIEKLILTGAAGAIHPDLRIGDMVIANKTIQHDMDCSPLFPQFEAPLLGISKFPCDNNLVQLAVSSFDELIDHGVPNFIDKESIEEFNLTRTKVHVGLIGSGDQFINSESKAKLLAASIQNMMCVEMEAGAVGQICYEHKVPFVVLRTISDYANGNAHIDFVQFVKKVVSPFTFAMVSKLMLRL